MTSNTAYLAAITAAVALTAATNAAVTPTPIVLDAQATSGRTSGPDAHHVGHIQLANGVVRDADGHQVGSFAYSCRWIAILPSGDPKEHCSGEGRTSDGRLDYAGTTTADAEPHLFHVVDGIGAYRGVHGSVLARDLGPNESLVTVELSATRAPLRIGVVKWSTADTPFRTRAGRLCRQAAAALAQLPRFPFQDFDPAHPNPTLLPQVGRFFTGAGDPRPILRRLDAGLHALGMPPTARASWTLYLTDRHAENVARQKQDDAALASNAQSFVKSLQDIDAAGRSTAIAAAVFGVPDCTL